MNFDIKFIPEDVCNYLAQKVQILEIIEDLTGCKAKRNGINYTMLCPFHEDHTQGNFIISPSKNICHCFACNEGGKAIDFIMKYKNWKYNEAMLYLSDFYKVDIPNDQGRAERRKQIEHTRPSTPRPEVLKQYGAIPSEDVRKYRGNTSIFAQYLYKVLKPEEVNKALELYKVGVYGNDERALFWYIDLEGVCREGKVMKYDANGHRNKDKDEDGKPLYPPFAVASRTYHINSVKRCLFGENLLKGCKCTVGLVEAEKTAVIMSVCLPGITWVSCGGASNLSASNWQVLKGYKVFVYPDADQVATWKDKVKQMEQDGINVKLQVKWMQYATIEDGNKYDVADVFLRLHTMPSKKDARSQMPEELLGLDDTDVYLRMFEDAKKIGNEMPF